MSERTEPILPESPPDDGLGFLAGERQEILNQLNETLERERAQMRPQSKEFQARHRGLLLPVVVNAAALLLVVAGAGLLFTWFNRREESLAVAARAETEGEGRLIQAIRREAARQLQERDLQISGFRGRYSSLNQEIDRLKSELDARLQGEAQGFNAALAQSLVERRQKLEEQGLTRTAVEQQLRAVEGELRAEQALRIEALKEQAAAVLQEKEAQRAAWLQQYSQAVRQARAEKDQLEQSLREQLQALESDAVRKYDALQGENARLTEELKRLQGAGAGQQTMLQQVLDAYGRIRDHLQNGRPTEAVKQLDDLRGYLSQESVASLPDVGPKLQGELFVIDSLKEWIQSAKTGARPVPAPAVPARDPTLDSARQIVEQADSRFQAGDTEGARKLYLSALARVPDLERSYQRLLKLAPPAAVQPSPAGPTAESAARAAAADARIQELEKSLSDARGQLEEVRRGRESTAAVDRRLLQALAAQRTAASGAAAAADGTEPSREELLNLVQAKLKTKEIIGSEPVRSQNPGLYEKLNRYFEEFEKISKQEGRRAGMREVSGSLDRLLQQKYGERLQPAYVQSSKDPFIQILDRLRALFE